MSVADARVSLDAVRAARARIAGRLRATPTVHKEALSSQAGVPVFLKCEHLQHTGSFKLRGALNLVSQLADEERARGVVAASAGNHAQGVAVAAREFGVQATIFMPEDATLSKVEATRNYGARIRLTGANLSEALVAARAHADETGALFVHPFDDMRVIEGQATLGLEIVEQVPEIETLVVPIGGGGLFAGVASVVREMRPACRIVGVQASACPSLEASLAAGNPVSVESHPSLADGICVKQPGELTFSIVRRLLDHLVVVDDDELASSMLWLIERAKQVVEGAGAAGVAALRSGRVEPTGPTVIVLGGGNIDPVALMPVIRHGLTTVGRFLRLETTLPDRPGELSRLLGLLARLRVNVLGVEHRREGEHVRVSETRVVLTLQTRNQEHVDEVAAALAAEGYRV